MLAAGYVSGAGGGGRGFALPALSSRHGPARWSDKHGRPRPTRPWPAMTPGQTLRLVLAALTIALILWLLPPCPAGPPTRLVPVAGRSQGLPACWRAAAGGVATPLP